MTNNEIAFTAQQIDAAYINSLVDLVNACRELDVKIDKVFHYQHGWKVTFEGFDGDAICHSGSYGSPCYCGLYNPSVECNDWSKDGRWGTYGLCKLYYPEILFYFPLTLRNFILFSPS